MADDNNGSKPVVYVPEQATDFLKDGIQLKKLLKALDKASKSALETLEKVMEETKDEKLKASCAEKILTFYLSTAEKENADRMQRMIAQIKIGNGQGKLIPLEGDEKPKRPTVDFSTIREIN